jgi:hypothetical protein
VRFTYPYFNFPYHNNYSRYGYHYSNSTANNNFNNTYINKDNDVYKKDKTGSISCTTFENNKKEEPSLDNDDSPLFQIFGINLYFDDILIVCILFFLYQEGVKDEGLFVVLILLLLT